MIIFQTETSVVDIFRCPQCNQTFLRGQSNISCCVMHAPGTCCHFTDKIVSEELVKEIAVMLKGAASGE